MNSGILFCQTCEQSTEIELLSNPIRWLTDVISPEHIEEISSFESIEVIPSRSGSLCLICKGGRMLCGKLGCPIIAKAQSLVKFRNLVDSESVEGSTPPGVFVGRAGYPRVSIGPMIPPYFGDTTILDTPEEWIGKSINEIIDYRFSLIRGKVRASIFDTQTENRMLDTLQELAMGSRPTDSEALFTKKPKKTILLSDETQPFGPSAPLKSFKTSSISVDKRIEKAFYDHDLKASDAAMQLYRDGVLVTRIQRCFSVGMFGQEARRKLVPTRWSITAVDSNISLQLIDEIKQYQTIDEYRVYTFTYLDNIYVAILTPEKWNFEWIEAWFPGTTWNIEGKTPAMMGDYEGYWGRTTYASVGGCYYSTRLAVTEKLSAERKQASALVLREIHPGYILPVGVWNVRESIRSALKTQPKLFDTFNAALQFAMSKMTIPLKHWIANSTILRNAFFQKKISDFFTEARKIQT